MKRPVWWNASQCGAPQERRFRPRLAVKLRRGYQESVTARICAPGIHRISTAAEQLTGNAANGRVLECVAGTPASEWVDSSSSVHVVGISL